MTDPCKLCGERVKGSAANAWWWHGQDIYHVKCMWDEIAYLTARLAEAEAAARFYARYYDGPSEALLGEADRKAFQWIERAEKAGGWE